MNALRPFCSLVILIGLFDGIACGVDQFDGGEVQVFEWGFDFGAVSYGYDDGVVGVDVGFCYALDVLCGDGAVGVGEGCVVGEWALVEEDVRHGCCGGVSGFELTRKRLDSGFFGLLEFGFGGGLGLDAFDFEHELLDGRGGDVGFDQAASEEWPAVTIEGE